MNKVAENIEMAIKKIMELTKVSKALKRKKNEIKTSDQIQNKGELLGSDCESVKVKMNQTVYDYVKANKYYDIKLK